MAAMIMIVQGKFFPWMFVLAGVGPVFPVGGCLYCAAQARLDGVVAVNGPATGMEQVEAASEYSDLT